MVGKNTSTLWDNFWKRDVSELEDVQTLENERSSVRWKRMKKRLRDHFGSLKGRKVIEIGAGVGTYAALLAQEGAEVTVLDYSKAALERAKEFAQRNNVTFSYVQADALSLSDTYINTFDISMSFGLAEHFQGKKRQKILQAHIDVLKKDGCTFISVPNAHNLPYQVYKVCMQSLHLWQYGEEYPFTRKELRERARNLNISHSGFLGDSFLWSLNYLNPFVAVQKLFFNKQHSYIGAFSQEHGTWLDEYLGYALVFWAVKN